VKRDGVRATLLWAVLSVIGIAVVLSFSMLPRRLSEEADAIDGAYVLLMALAVPVLMLVVTILVYSAIRFRSDGPDEDGPPLKADKKILRWWLAVTGGLAVFVIINPGFVGLAEIRGDSAAADMVIQVEARRFFWTVIYPDGTVLRSPANDMVLPEGERIRFDVSAPDTDVLHSFWIPAFRMKIDAVPGRVTQVWITPSETGSFEENVNLRIQCAELCGAAHSDMAMHVQVVESAEFASELAAEAGEGG
jgi:cytochrome c oxidase subunit 2